MAKKNKKRIIVIQKGKNKYAHEKMQGAGIKMYILERRIECEKIKEVTEGVSGPFRCYVIGDDMFCNGIKRQSQTESYSGRLSQNSKMKMK